jgi:hypothetical protein
MSDDLRAPTEFNFARPTTGAVVSAGTVGVVGVATSLLPGSLMSASDAPSVHITGLITQSVIIIVAIIAATRIYGILLRGAAQATVKPDQELDDYRRSLGQMIQALLKTSFNTEVLNNVAKYLGEMHVPTRFLAEHRKVIVALADRATGTTTPFIGELTGLLAATIMPALEPEP